jgi:hypothetical protein
MYPDPIQDFADISAIIVTQQWPSPHRHDLPALRVIRAAVELRSGLSPALGRPQNHPRPALRAGRRRGVGLPGPGDQVLQLLLGIRAMYRNAPQRQSRCLTSATAKQLPKPHSDAAIVQLLLGIRTMYRNAPQRQSRCLTSATAKQLPKPHSDAAIVRRGNPGDQGRMACASTAVRDEGLQPVPHAGHTSIFQKESLRMILP